MQGIDYFAKGKQSCYFMFIIYWNIISFFIDLWKQKKEINI